MSHRRFLKFYQVGKIPEIRATTRKFSHLIHCNCFIHRLHLISCHLTTAGLVVGIGPVFQQQVDGCHIAPIGCIHEGRPARTQHSVHCYAWRTRIFIPCQCEQTCEVQYLISDKSSYQKTAIFVSPSDCEI